MVVRSRRTEISTSSSHAKGNLEGFAKQHGIRELELSDDGVGWRGCGKNTLACHLNLYTNRLGLNTPPCCRDHMKDLCHYVASCLKEMEVVHWMEGSTISSGTPYHPLSVNGIAPFGIGLSSTGRP